MIYANEMRRENEQKRKKGYKFMEFLYEYKLGS